MWFGQLGKTVLYFFPPPPFSFILRTRAFFSLRMFASVWLKMYLISFLSLRLKHVFLRSIHWLTFLTPSFAIMLFPSPPFLWTKSVSLHLKTNKFAEASGSEPNSKDNVQYPKKKTSLSDFGFWMLKCFLHILRTSIVDLEKIYAKLSGTNERETSGWRNSVLTFCHQLRKWWLNVPLSLNLYLYIYICT